MTSSVAFLHTCKSRTWKHIYDAHIHTVYDLRVRSLRLSEDRFFRQTRRNEMRKTLSEAVLQMYLVDRKGQRRKGREK